MNGPREQTAHGDGRRREEKEEGERGRGEDQKDGGEELEGVGDGTMADSSNPCLGRAVSFFQDLVC